MINYSNYDIDLVQSYWVDISQDVNWISEELDFTKNKVEEILNYLSKEGMIEGWNINESFNMNFPDENDPNYFYNYKKIGEEYDNNIFQILAKSIYVNPDDIGLIIDCVVNFRYNEYPIVILYFSDQELYYGSRGNEWDNLIKKLGDQYAGYLESILYQIVKDNVPYDFWEVRSRYN